MIKVIFILYLSTISIYAQTVNFRENKYIEALELYTYRDGNVSYNKEKTVVKYKDGKTITKVGNTLTIHNEENELLTTIDLNKKPEVALLFRLNKALFLKNFKSLEENFLIKKLQNKRYRFEPKENMKKAVTGIELLLKTDGSIDYFTIDFKNRDTIKVEAK